MTPKVATMLLVSRGFSEGAQRCAVCVCVLLVKNDEMPQQRHSLRSIPSQIKALLGILFPIISSVQPCHIEATLCPGETRTKKSVMEKLLAALSGTKDWFLPVQRQNNLFICIYFLHCISKMQKNPNFLGPSVLFTFSQLSTSLSQRTASQQGSPDPPHHWNFLKKNFLFRKHKSRQHPDVRTIWAVSCQCGGTIAVSLPTPTSPYPHLGGSNKPCTGTPAGIFLWSHPFSHYLEHVPMGGGADQCWKQQTQVLSPCGTFSKQETSIRKVMFLIFLLVLSVLHIDFSSSTYSQHDYYLACFVWLTVLGVQCRKCKLSTINVNVILFQLGKLIFTIIGFSQQGSQKLLSVIINRNPISRGLCNIL